MKVVIAEYGRLTVAIIIAVMVILFINYMLNSDKGIHFVFNNHSLYSEYDEELGQSIVGGSYADSPLDALNGVSNISKKIKPPVFQLARDGIKIDNNITVAEFVGYIGKNLEDLDYKSDTDCYKYKFNLDGIKFRLMRGTDKDPLLQIVSYDTGSEQVVDASSMNLVIVTYTPRQIPVYNGATVQMQFEMEEVDAYDKYGNRIYYKDGDTWKFMKTQQLVYNVTKWHEHNSSCGASCGYEDINGFYIEMNKQSKFKVIYRYTDKNGLKAEYIKLFKNESIDKLTQLKIEGKVPK